MSLDAAPPMGASVRHTDSAQREANRHHNQAGERYRSVGQALQRYLRYQSHKSGTVGTGEIGKALRNRARAGQDCVGVTVVHSGAAVPCARGFWGSSRGSNFTHSNPVKTRSVLASFGTR